MSSTTRNKPQSAPTPRVSSTPERSHGSSSGKVVSIRAGAQPINPTVIAVTSGKGGVGKTNISANLAIALGLRGVRVLCIDADLGLANMDIIFGLAPTLTTADLVNGHVDAEDVLLEGPTNVWLLPGASGQYDLANLNDQQRRDLFSAVDTLDSRFDIVIVDTGAGLGSNSVGFSSAAKDILVVVSGEPTSVADADGMIKVLNTRCGVHRVKIVANMVQSAADGEAVFRRLSSLTDRFLNIALEYMGHIPQDSIVSRSVMRGEPFVSNYPDCAASNAITGIAGKILAADDQDDRQGAIRLFWRKLLRQGNGQ